MITLKAIDNDYYLNDVKGEFYNFNFDGKYKQTGYSIYIDKDGHTCKEWTFKGKL